MKKFLSIAVILTIIVSMIGCSGKNQNANIGGVVGATLCGGGVYAMTRGRSDFTAPLTFISAIACGVGLSSLGSKFDQYNNALLQKTMNQVKDGEKLSYKSPQIADTEITITPVNTFKKVEPQISKTKESFCRDVSWKISHNGQSSFGDSVVCKNDITGEWETIIPMSAM